MKFNAVKNNIVCDDIDEIIKLQIVKLLVFKKSEINDKIINTLCRLSRYDSIERDSFIDLCVKDGIYSRTNYVSNVIDKLIDKDIIVSDEKSNICIKDKILHESPILIVDNIYYYEQ